jgi:hypothetical protein
VILVSPKIPLKIEIEAAKKWLEDNFADIDDEIEEYEEIIYDAQAVLENIDAAADDIENAITSLRWAERMNDDVPPDGTDGGMNALSEMLPLAAILPVYAGRKYKWLKIKRRIGKYANKK